MYRAVVVLTFLFVSLFGVRDASAVCATDGQAPCYRFWTTQSVFVGKVVRIEKFPGSVFDEVRTIVRVVEAFRGVKAGDQLELFMSVNECVGVSAEDASEIFVYASRNAKGQLWAHGCGETKLLEDADADLAYARSVNEQGPAALFYGDVFEREDLTGGPSDFSPMKGVRVRVRGVNFEMETETDEEGNFAMPLPGAGKYTAEAIPPAGFADRFDGLIAFELPDRRACYRAMFQLQLNGRIRGRVVNRDGEPIRNLVVRAGRDVKRSARTGPSGEFDLGPLEEGNYSVGAITGARDRRFAEASFAKVEAGRPTDLPPLIFEFEAELVTLSVTITAPQDAGEAFLLVTAQDGEELGEPIRITTDSIRFLVEKNQSFELLAATNSHEAKAKVRTAADTAVTLTLRPSKAQ